MGQFLFRCLTVVAGAVIMAACSSTAEKPQPSPLPAFTAQLPMQKVWSSKLGEVITPLSASVSGTRVAIASTTGDLALLDAQTGSDVWRMNIKDRIQAGVGGDGQRFAVVTQNNELVTVESGREIWRQKLQAGTFTAPLVVAWPCLAADRWSRDCRRGGLFHLVAGGAQSRSGAVHPCARQGRNRAGWR